MSTSEAGTDVLFSLVVHLIFVFVNLMSVILTKVIGFPQKTVMVAPACCIITCIQFKEYLICWNISPSFIRKLL